MSKITMNPMTVMHVWRVWLSTSIFIFSLKSESTLGKKKPNYLTLNSKNLRRDLRTEQSYLFLKKIDCSALHGGRMKHLHDLVEHMSYDALKAGRSTFQNFQGPLISFFTSQVALLLLLNAILTVLLLLRFPRKRRRKSRFFMTTSQKF